jgi:hypothetical protein
VNGIQNASSEVSSVALAGDSSSAVEDMATLGYAPDCPEV